jgi:hypothetical protein
MVAVTTAAATMAEATTFAVHVTQILAHVNPSWYIATYVTLILAIVSPLKDIAKHVATNMNIANVKKKKSPTQTLLFTLITFT